MKVNKKIKSWHVRLHPIFFPDEIIFERNKQLKAKKFESMLDAFTDFLEIINFNYVQLVDMPFLPVKFQKPKILCFCEENLIGHFRTSNCDWVISPQF